MKKERIFVINVIKQVVMKASEIICTLLFAFVFLTNVDNVSAIPVGMRCKNAHVCLHGGTLLMPRSIFGYCRCICPGNWGGPMCELRRYKNYRLKKLIRIKHTIRSMISKSMVQS